MVTCVPCMVLVRPAYDVRTYTQVYSETRAARRKQLAGYVHRTIGSMVLENLPGTPHGKYIHSTRVDVLTCNVPSGTCRADAFTCGLYVRADKARAYYVAIAIAGRALQKQGNCQLFNRSRCDN
jgi:hypothetical protein